MDTAEAAVEGTPDAGMVHGRALAKERGPQILLDWKAMKRRPGKFVRTFHRPLGIGAMKAEGILVAKSTDRIERPLASQCVDELKQGIFPLTADYIVDVLRIERGIGIQRGEVAAPDDAHLRAQPPNLAAGFHGRNHLWSGHAGNAKKLNLVIVNRAQDGCGRVVLQIAIDDPVFFTAFQHSREREHREREPAVARFSGSGMEEDDHFVTLAA